MKQISRFIKLFSSLLVLTLNSYSQSFSNNVYVASNVWITDVNQTNHTLDINFNAKSIAGASSVQFAILYFKSGTTDYKDAYGGNYVIASQTSQTITINDVYIDGNPINISVVLAYKPLNNAFGWARLKNNNPYLADQSFVQAFNSPTQDLQDLLGQIDQKLDYLKYAINGYAFLADAKYDIRGKVDDIAAVETVQGAIGKATNLLNYLNSIQNIMSETDDIKRYFKLMNALISISVPKPFDKILKGYCDVASSMYTAITAIATNYGTSGFSATAGYGYNLQYRLRSYNSLLGNDYFDKTEFDKYIKSEKIVITDINTGSSTYQEAYGDFEADGVTKNIDITSYVDYGLTASQRLFYQIEFENQHITIIPISSSNTDFISWGNSKAIFGIDIRTKVPEDLGPTFDVKLYKPTFILW